MPVTTLELIEEIDPAIRGWDLGLPSRPSDLELHIALRRWM